MPQDMCTKIQICGDFIEPDERPCEFLKIGFSPMAVPIQQRWRNNGLSADFLADYLSTFFPGEDSVSAERQTTVKGGVSYIANELLENAMKFTFAPTQHAISLEMYLDADAIRLYVTNSVNPDNVGGFQQLIRRLLTEDTNELYMEQLLQNTEDNSGSGLGFLTMINDYEARLAWKFVPLPEDPCTVHVTTMAYLPL